MPLWRHITIIALEKQENRHCPFIKRKNGPSSLKTTRIDGWNFIKSGLNGMFTSWATPKYQVHPLLFRFDGPVEVTCFEKVVKDTVTEVGTWLNFLKLDHRRLGCISADPVGQFYRKKTLDYSHLFGPREAEQIHKYISQVSKMLVKGGHTDCTKLFTYDKCC